MKKDNKIIICIGGSNEPARFWNWAIGTEEEYTKEMKDKGWVKSQCRKYLSIKQLKYLNS